MISLVAFAKAALHAFDDVRFFLARYMSASPPLLDYPITDQPGWSFLFAYLLTGVAPQGFTARGFPWPHYGSWLLVLPRPAIAVNEPQLRAWATKAGLRSNVEVRLQVARTILHEVGHMRLHPHLLNPAPAAPFAQPARGEDEDEAWVYAYTVLAIIQGDYALCSRSTNGFDDTPAIPL